MKFNNFDTPVLLVYREKLLENIRSMADILKGKSINLRPHIKTHKCPEIAKMQIDNGAKGITVSKLGEAEVMSERGFKDILIAYPIFGEVKKERLVKVYKNTDNLIISIDSFKVALFLSDIGISINNKINCLFELNTGLNRTGQRPSDKTIDLIKEIIKLPGIRFKGLMIYPGVAHNLESLPLIEEEVKKEYSLLISFIQKLKDKGINCEIVSGGSTLSIEFEKDFKIINELRPGTYVFNDRSHIEMKMINEDKCAATVLATVISVPEKNRAVIDAGAKCLGRELLFNDILKGFGLVKDRPDLLIENLYEEHGVLKSSISNINLSIGDRLEIIPNHICLTVNNFDNFTFIENNHFLQEVKISCRGKYQ